MSEINPKYIDEEPMCSGIDCPFFVEGGMFDLCFMHPSGLDVEVGDICIAGIRQQRDRLRRQVEGESK